MRKQETQARIRCLTRQIESLRDELRREAKRSAWAIERFKEKETQFRALESRATEQASVNSRLAHELAAAEETHKATVAAKDTEIRAQKEEAKERDECHRAKASATIHQLMLIVRQLLRLENILGNRRSRHGLSVAGRVEKMIGQTAQKLLTATDSLKTGQGNGLPENNYAPRPEEEDAAPGLSRDSSNVQKILATYRKTVSKLREQVGYTLKRDPVQSLVQTRVVVIV